jgi:RNA polymerase sigma factor (sigma-70 family)
MPVDLLTQLRSTGAGQKQDWLVMQQALARLDQGIQDAVWFAAVPHWFEADILSAVLEKPKDLTTSIVNSLRKLSFVESFPELGLNIHEYSRRLLLERFWKEQRALLVEYSAKIQRYCEGQDQDKTAWRIEIIYHCLTANATEGIKLFIDQVNTWKEERRDDKVEALIKAALEVVAAKRLPPKFAQTIEYTDASLRLVYGRKEAPRGGDRELADRFLAADAEAVKKVEGWIVRAAWPYQRRLYEQWDDILQDARLEVIRLLGQGKFQGESSLRTYLWRVVSHVCLDYLRSQGKWKWEELVVDSEDPESVIGRYIHQETDQLAVSEKDLLIRVLESVPQDCRELWRMMAAGLAYREMGEKLGVPEGVLRMRVLRCREKAIQQRKLLLARPVSKRKNV